MQGMRRGEQEPAILGAPVRPAWGMGRRGAVTRRHLQALGIVAFTVVVVGLLLSRSCGQKNGTALPPNAGAGSTQVELDQPEVQELASPLTGPYYFSKVLSPSVVELTDMNAQRIPVRLAGLSEADDQPVLGDGAPVKQKTAEELQAAAERAARIQEFKMDALKKACADKQLWLSQLTQTPPFDVYLFRPLQSQPDLKNPRGSATLINAQLLREGQANLDLADPGHPLFDKMLDCELICLLEAQAQKRSDSLWTKFALQLPDHTLDERLGALKSTLR